MASWEEWQNALAERSRWSPARRAASELVSFAGLQWMELALPATDMNSARVDLIKALIPLKRMGDVSEIAGLVAYLASEEAGFITGASLTIDGGYVA